MTTQSGLDLKGLHAFLTVAEHKTVRKAADILGMTPSAVSQSIASLEMQLGVELFDRETRPMRLTSAGRRLLLDGSRLLEEIERVRSRVCSETLSARALRLGLGESVAATSSPWLLAQLRGKVADLVVYSDLTKPLVERLQNGKLDVIVCAGPQIEGDKWARQLAYEEEFLLVTARGLPSVKTIEELRRLAQTRPYICYNTESSDQVQANRILSAGGMLSAERIAVSSSYALVGLIAQTGGFGFLPPANLWCGRQFLADVRFAELPQSLRETRKMWVVGEAVGGIESIELVRSTAAAVMREKMLEEFEAAAPGLGRFVSVGVAV